MAKKLNVGLIGYGFMGRTHSNAYSKVNHFFDLAYEPVKHVICGLEETDGIRCLQTHPRLSHRLHGKR